MNRLDAIQVLMVGRDIPTPSKQMDPGTLNVSITQHGPNKGNVTLQIGGAYYLVSAEFNREDLLAFLKQELALE